MSSYLTTATASTTYATITNLNSKENTLTFSAPLTRTTNTISLDLSLYDTIATAFYRNGFDIITYLAPVNYFGSNIKVYCIFEDLL